MKKTYFAVFILILSTVELCGQCRRITLKETLEIATDSSVQVMQARSTLLQGKLEYHNFKIYHLPKITLKATPISYNQVFIKRYDSENNIDIYRPQQSLNSYGNMSIQQNFGLTGGSFFINTELGYLENFGSSSSYKQFTSVPFRIGYSQNLFGFNNYKWEKQIQPVRHNRIEKEHLCKIEEINKIAVNHFFDLAYAQTMYKLSKQNLKNIETLYQIGLKKVDMGAISQSDLLLLKLETLNYKRIYDNSKLDLLHNQNSFCNFLRIKSDSVKVIFPNEPKFTQLSVKKSIEKALENNPIINQLEEELLVAKKELELAKITNRFSANINASIGFNQIASSLKEVYKKSTRQDVFRVSINIPILDWGINKSKIIIASEELNISKMRSQQKMQIFIDEVTVCVNQLNTYRRQIKNVKEAIIIANQTYKITEKMFVVGKTNVNNLNTSISKKIETQGTYVQILKKYWDTYYKLRKLVLFDLINNKSI